MARGGNVNVGFSTMDFGDGKWSVRKKQFLRMVCLFETVFFTLGGTSLAPIYFAVSNRVPQSPPSMEVGGKYFIIFTYDVLTIISITKLSANYHRTITKMSL